MTDTAIAERETAEIAERPTAEVVTPERMEPTFKLFAETQEQMDAGLRGVESALAFRAKEAQVDLDDLEENLEISIKRKWRCEVFRRHIAKQKKRLTYYEKALAAVKAGYALVPDQEGTVFAVRTDRKKPPRRVTDGGIWQVPDAKCRSLPEGEGRYVSDSVIAESTEIPDPNRPQDTNWTKTKSWACGFLDVEFPVAIAKPEILNATGRAMARKLFDEIVIVPQGPGKDPFIVGRINDPSSLGWGTYARSATFIIGWFIDVRDL